MVILQLHKNKNKIKHFFKLINLKIFELKNGFYYILKLMYYKIPVFRRITL